MVFQSQIGNVHVMENEISIVKFVMEGPIHGEVMINCVDGPTS